MTNENQSKHDTAVHA